jgi:hypothetical protein
MEKLRDQKMKGNSDSEITLLVVVPAQAEPWENTFPKTAKIADVITAVIQKFGFAANGKYELKRENDPNAVLEPQRPLVSYGIKDGDKLIFIDFGQAV